MNVSGPLLAKLIFWGCVVFLLYGALFAFSGQIEFLALTTPNTCIVASNDSTRSLYRIDAQRCMEINGYWQAGHWWQVVIPVVIAFAISLAHGIFTGLFWDVMGLKPAKATSPKSARTELTNLDSSRSAGMSNRLADPGQKREC